MDVAELIAVLDDAHQQRNFQPTPERPSMTSAYKINSNPGVKAKTQASAARKGGKGKATDDAKDSSIHTKRFARPTICV